MVREVRLRLRLRLRLLIVPELMKLEWQLLLVLLSRQSLKRLWD